MGKIVLRSSVCLQLVLEHDSQVKKLLHSNSEDASLSTKLVRMSTYSTSYSPSKLPGSNPGLNLPTTRHVFFNMGLSRPLFGFISLLVHWLQLMDWHTIIDNEDRKQERRIEVSLIVWSKTSLIEKAQRPARIETVCQKSHGPPEIRTWPARTQTCCSTTAAWPDINWITKSAIGSKQVTPAPGKLKLIKPKPLNSVEN